MVQESVDQPIVGTVDKDATKLVCMYCTHLNHPSTLLYGSKTW